MIEMRKRGVTLRGDPQTRELGRILREISHFDGANVVDDAIVIAVTAHAIGGVTDLSRNIPEIGLESLPFGGIPPLVSSK